MSTYHPYWVLCKDSMNTSHELSTLWATFVHSMSTSNPKLSTLPSLYEHLYEYPIFCVYSSADHVLLFWRLMSSLMYYKYDSSIDSVNGPFSSLLSLWTPPPYYYQELSLCEHLLSTYACEHTVSTLSFVCTRHSICWKVLWLWCWISINIEMIMIKYKWIQADDPASVGSKDWKASFSRAQKYHKINTFSQF